MRGLVIVAVVVSACSVGNGPAGGPSGGGTGPDASSSPGVDAPSGISPDAAGSGSGSGSDCVDQVTMGLDTGHHHVGEDCQNSCHNHGFTLSGTLYNGNTGVSGATIIITDASNQKLSINSQMDGNFYTAQALAFPVSVVATMCPNTVPMVAQATQGGCNRNGCHTSGMKIHLP